jgi:hypothetical protein
MGRVTWKRVSEKKLPVRKRSVKNGSVLGCVYNDSACVRVREDFDVDLEKSVSYRACVDFGVDGRIRRMCPKFKESADFPYRKDLVRKALLEDSVPK